MPKPSLVRRAARCGALLAVLAAGAAAPPSASAASTFTCEASALRGTILTAPSIEPITANKGQPACKAAKAGGADLTGSLPLPLGLNVAAAQTSLEGSDAQPGSQKAGAVGGLLDARVKTLPELPLRIPIPAIPDNVATITVPVSQLKPVTDPLTGLPLPITLPTQDITIDLRAALQALLPDGRLPNLDVLRLQTAISYATAGCQNGKLELAGASQVAGLSVLGQPLPVNEAIDRNIRIVDTAEVDPSDINVSTLPLPPGIAPELLPQVQALIQPALDALPTISIPATALNVKVTPAQTIREGDKLTQRALEVQLSLLGQSLANLVVGEASVSARDVVCVAQRQAAVEEQLSCTTKRLVLVDVLRRGNRVRLFGVADRKLAGRRVSIRFTHTGRVVARPRVGPDGNFSATAPLPPMSIRNTNLARYQAQVGREKSLRLKLARRMVWRSLSSRNGRVTLAGRVVRPLGKPVQTIVVKRRVSCKRFEVVKRFKPSRNGTFRVTVAAPPKSLAATYRMQTRVRHNTRNPKLFDTYTLPRTVEIR